MNRRTQRFTVVLLATIAVLLGANLAVMISREGESLSLLPAAYGQRQPPIAGGGGLFIMPAQISSNTWGCYLMDIDSGTLCVYQFFPGDKRLQFIAARNFRHDRRLGNYNTFPPPDEIADLVERERKLRSATQPASGTP